jgi:hypothetical protein
MIRPHRLIPQKTLGEIVVMAMTRAPMRRGVNRTYVLRELDVAGRALSTATNA